MQTDCGRCPYCTWCLEVDKHEVTVKEKTRDGSSHCEAGVLQKDMSGVPRRQGGGQDHRG